MLLYKNTGHVEPATNFRLGKSGQPMINQNIEKIKEAFFSQLSHNLMTHASNIIGFSELMKNEELRQEDKLQYIQFVIELSNMILTLAEDVKSLNKLSPESFALNESKANLNSFMDEIYNAAQNSNEIADGVSSVGVNGRKHTSGLRQSGSKSRVVRKYPSPLFTKFAGSPFTTL